MSTNQGHAHSLSAPSNNHLSPHKPNRDRSLSASSRPSSRTSIRSGRVSPFVEDPIALRNEISEHKHLIRQKTARLTELERQRASARYYYNSDYSDDMTASVSGSPPRYSFIEQAPNGPPKEKRRTSYEVLADIAGPDSNLPLPKRESTSFSPEDSIKEGVPALFSPGPTSPTHHKRPSSPTRTLSRIPIAAVGNARALADDGSHPLTTPQRPGLPASITTSSLSPNDSSDTTTTGSTSPSIQPPSPNPTPSPLIATNALLATTAAYTRRSSLTPGGTTKVLADLQTGVVNARNALENTRAQLRVSQRTVAQLTRQNEDLKEAKERLRLQNEGLNNVVARKERLLQEVLERARKAEAEAATLKGQLKSETTTSKKTIREMESALSESTALSQKCEREYITLRDSIKGLTESWKTDTDRLREEVKRREERWKTEAESIGAKYKKLLAEVKNVDKKKESIQTLREEDEEARKKVEKVWMEEIQNMKQLLEKSNKDSREANETARILAAELARLRRLIQSSSASSLSAIVAEAESGSNLPGDEPSAGQVEISVSSST
ncbi:hypothetical protein AX16_008110 [Volvariella volvacea WC 439]|nr:hypothetical protein AX16_008110 [Volvariella volvacea WC 439]